MAKETETTQREQQERGHRPDDCCGAELVTDFDMEEIGDYLHDKIGLTSLDCWFEWDDIIATLYLKGEFPIKASVTHDHPTLTRVLSDDQRP